MRVIISSVLVLTLLAACGDTDRPLRGMSASGNGPDEFAVIPVGPLQIPQALSLPEPTPGGSNRTDPQPNADAIVALGGRPSAQIAGGVPAGDAALVRQTSRYGVDPNIRAELAVADEQLRDRKRRSNVFNPLNRDRYFPAYANQALDASAELARLRSLGVAVPNPQAVRSQQQPRSQTSAEPIETAAVEPEPGLLQRTFESLVGERRSPDGAPQNCVFRTVPPDNRLQRVCTPIEEEEAQ